MTARLILETDIIDVTNPPVLLYGDPGSGKSSLAFTAKNPICLDFDGGAHRSAFRKTTLRFDNWEDVIAEQKSGRFVPFDTVILDTVDTLLKYMGTSIMSGNVKLGNRAGGLSQNGWGVLKTTFDNWLSGLIQSGKQVVMVAHVKEDKDGDMKMMRPDIAGGSYGIVMRSADIVGYLSYRNNHRAVMFDPTDSFFAKNGARLVGGPIPDFTAEPAFLSTLLIQAKGNLGHTAQASAAVAKAVEEWREKIEGAKDLEALNVTLPGLATLTGTAKSQVWALILQETAKASLVFDKTAKKFTQPAEEGKGAA